MKAAMKTEITNCIILLMGIAGTGKRTIAEAIVRQSNFKLVHHHSWTDPILNLLGTDESVWWSLDEKGWAKLNEARDIIFSTISDVCPHDTNFVITFEMLDKDPYHQIFYDKVLEIVKKRNSLFIPVRLICDTEELIIRSQAKDRKIYFKTSDINLIKMRSKQHEVFYSKHNNEMTLDVTKIAADEAANKILSFTESLSINYKQI